MTMHEGKPWRTVEHIETCRGPRGGAFWTLTLACGHRAYRSIPPIRVDLMVVVPLVRMDKMPRRRPLPTAPHRVRCYFCPAEEPPCTT